MKSFLFVNLNIVTTEIIYRNTSRMQYKPGQIEPANR